MRVFVPVANHAKQPQKSRIVRACLGVSLWALSACTSTPTAAVDEGTGVTGGITVKIAKPTADDLKVPYAASIALSGTLALDKGVTLKKTGAITVSLGDRLTVPCSGSGNKFNCTLDTTGKDKLTGQPLIGCNEVLSITVTANGTLAGSDVSGSASVDAEIDQCEPQRQLFALPHTESTAPPVFVGKQKIGVVVSDTRLKEASLDVFDPDGNSVLPSGPVVMPAGTTSWKFEYTLDTSTLTKTEALQVVLKAKDQTNDEVQTTLDVYSVKAATFLGQVNDVFLHPTNDVVMVTAAEAPDGFVAFTSDPTPTSGLDRLADAVVGTSDGVYIRAGMPKRNSNGVAINNQGEELGADADTHAHSLKFEFDEALPVIPLAKYRAIHWGTQSEIDAKAVANVVRVFVRDLDADGDLDIVAVANISGDGPSRGEAWAILNVQANVVLSNAETRVVRGFKVADVIQLPARARTAELGDLNGDGQEDLLIGATKETIGTQTVDQGLLTLLLRPDPICGTPGDTAAPTKPCGDAAVDYATLRNAEIFAKDVKVAPNMGVTGVASIATGDFYQGGGLDICVGSADRPLVSCYRNVDGALNQAQDAYQFKDGVDTGLIRVTDLTPKNDKDGPDLLVASASGKYLRWLKGNHNGIFSYIEDTSITHRSITVSVKDMAIAPVGPKGEQYVLASVGDEVYLVPLDPADDEYVRACFRSWIVGGSATRVSANDVDGDGILDLVSASNKGIAIAQGATKDGKFTGGFVAPNVHHICASYWPPSTRGVQEIAAAKVGDFNKDKKQELLVIGVESKSDQPGNGGTCYNASGEHPMPVWPMAVFMNDTGLLNPEPRQTEFSPYHPTAIQNAGVVQDCSKGSPSSFGHVTAAALADLNADGYPDLVTVRSDSNYAVGKELSQSKVCTCLFDEQNEVENVYGEEEPAGDSPDKSVCCRNFSADDPNKTKPLIGFGGGAPMSRASTHIFLSSATGPLGMPATCNAVPPAATGAGICHMAPIFAFAGGRSPVDVHVADLDGDKKPDIITAMDNDGVNCFKGVIEHGPFLQARVRLFKNVGGSVGDFVQPTFISDSSSSKRDQIQLPNCVNTLSVSQNPVSYRMLPDELRSITTGPWPNPTTGKLDPATIFGLGHAYGQIGILPHTTVFNYLTRVLSPMGGPPDAFNATDINGDGLTDMLVLSNVGTQVAILTGKLNNGDTKDAAFETQMALPLLSATFPGAAAASMGDVNNDGHIDLVLIGTDASVLFLLGTGTGSFVRYAGAPVAADAKSVEIVDMDNDGCQDLVVRSIYGVTVVHNEGASLEDCPGAVRWAHDAELFGQ